MKSLKGRVVLVTGAAMGMGKALAASLLNEGCTVALVDINSEKLAETASELKNMGPCKAYTCNIADRSAVAGLADQVNEDLGTPAILINNAGVMKAAELIDLDPESIERMIEVNLLSLFWLTKAFLPGMIKLNEANIVNIASAGGILAIPNLSAYCASKFGVVGFSDAIRQEMKKNRYNVAVTCVCPNTVGTGMFDGAKMVTGTSLLKPEQVVTKIIDGIKKNKPMVAVPGFSIRFLTPLLKVLLPINVMDRLNSMLGMWNANDATRGRCKANQDGRLSHERH